MDFDDSLFQCGDAAAVSEGEGREREGDSRKKERGKDDEYVAKNCPPEWFNEVDLENGDSGEEDHVILKYRADSCYRRQQIHAATDLYLQIIKVLPSSNRVVLREVMDSLARCFLKRRDFGSALRYAQQLVTPPHDNDASSWQLTAACYKGLGGHIADYVLSLQKCNILQRHNAATWLELAEAYSTQCTDMLGTCERMMSYSKLTKFSNTDAKLSKDDANNSNSDEVESTKFVSFLSNTVILFRPYFKWKNEGNFKQETLIVSRLLGRHVSVETFVDELHLLPWKQQQSLLQTLFQVSSQCCLIWARQLQVYSVRHCQSFARDIQTERLRVIEHLIGGLHDDDLSLYLIQCFNHSTMFDESVADQ